MSDDEDDPFERLGVDDREGDPWEKLDPPEAEGEESGADADEEGGKDSEDDRPVDADDPPADPLTDRTPGVDASGQDVPAGDTDGEAQPDTDQPIGPDAEDPLSGVRTPEDDPFEGGTFERADVGPVDPDEIWEEVVSEDDEESTPEPPAETRYSEVSKHSFCEQCEYFSGPPDVHCTHETAEIVEFLDMETVRLLDCPIVAEREALEQED